MPWHPPCALVRLILPAYSFFLRLPLSRLMEGASHCVYLGYIVAVSLPLHSLDWILTFSSFRFIFPVQFSRCALGLISTSWSFGYGPAGSASRLSSCASRPPGLPHEPRIRVSEVSFPILQNDTVFQSSCPVRSFGLSAFTAFAVPLRYLYRYSLTSSAFVSDSLRTLDLGFD